VLRQMRTRDGTRGRVWAGETVGPAMPLLIAEATVLQGSGGGSSLDWLDWSARPGGWGYL
jgi:hypothetical protein